MGLLLTLIVASLAIFLSAGLVTAVRRHGWTVGMRRYGAALGGLGVGVGHAVARPALDGQEASRASHQEAAADDLLGEVIAQALTGGEGERSVGSAVGWLRHTSEYFSGPQHTYQDIMEIGWDPTHPWYDFYWGDDD